MSTILKAIGAVAILALGAAPALASTQAFSAAKPGAGMDVDDFDQQVQIFNRHDIGDLLRAKSVAVVKFDDAWTDGGDASKAFEAMDESGQAIGLLREALKANPAAEKLLAQHHIAIDQVIDIAPGTDGTVQIYVS